MNQNRISKCVLREFFRNPQLKENGILDAVWGILKWTEVYGVGDCLEEHLAECTSEFVRTLMNMSEERQTEILDAVWEFQQAHKGVK